MQLDETTNSKTKKELQIRIIFWSKSVKRIVNRHLITFFIDKGHAQTLFEYLMKAINMHNLLTDQVLTLGRDGPNVMKALFNLFQKELLTGGHEKLIDIGSCLLHMVNNAFMKGLECMSLDVSDVLIKLFYFFHQRSERTAKFDGIQKELYRKVLGLILHTQIRWLTIGPAANRARVISSS